MVAYTFYFKSAVSAGRSHPFSSSGRLCKSLLNPQACGRSFTAIRYKNGASKRSAAGE
ncbi:protein of unknown function [Candidatus Filomicrobium marinum]|uniref:Uncharacterized protein n=1 Tax=Candidatus Filomicrobium marinum TaxID=1608628 RepID=A0A0D6JCT9_9HYPH|nr:protein of unknown function [Candidatus Filomicrobium marinum]